MVVAVVMADVRTRGKEAFEPREVGLGVEVGRTLGQQLEQRRVGPGLFAFLFDPYAAAHTRTHTHTHNAPQPINSRLA